MFLMSSSCDDYDCAGRSEAKVNPVAIYSQLVSLAGLNGRHRRSSLILAGLVASALFLVILIGTLAPPASAEELRLIRVQIETKDQFKTIVGRQMDISYIEPGKYVEIVAGQDEIDFLSDKGYKVVVQVQDLVSYYADRAMADNGGYKTFSDVAAYLDSIHMDHPSITTAPFSIGTTHEGRDLWAMKISDNPGVDEAEPEVLYNGLHHAREPIGAEALLYFMDHLTDNYGSDPTATGIVNGRELYLVPVVNPDGYVYNETTYPSGGGMWRKNRRDNGDGSYGVDLNRNYGYQWGYDDEGSSPSTSSALYRGPSSFSEPETQALRDLCESHEFIIIMNYHSYGNLFLFPWGYDQLYTPDHLYFMAMADSATTFNGYSPSPGWGLYVTNGNSDDWDYGEQTTKGLAFGFTPEVGSSSDGFWPLPSRILPLCQENLPVNILMAQIADNPRRLAPPVAPAMLASTPVATGPFVVDWSLADPYNPAGVYELVELTGLTKVVDDAESGPGLWELDGFSTSGARRYSGSTSYYSGSGDDLSVTLQTGDHIDVGPSDTLSMWCWYNIEDDWDYAYVQVSTDGGITFLSIEGNITTNSDPNGQNRGNGITGSSGGWIEGRFPLNGYSAQQVLARVLYSTDYAVTEEGIYCDNIGPVDSLAGSTVLSGSIPDPFYNVSGRMPGLYHYKVRAKDSEGQWGFWSDRGTVEVQETVVPALSNISIVLFGLATFLLAAYLFRRRANRARGSLTTRC